MPQLCPPPRPFAHHWVYEDNKLPRCSACFAVRYNYHWADECLMAKVPSKRELFDALLAAGKLTMLLDADYHLPQWRNRREKRSVSWPLRSCTTSKRNGRRGEISALRRDRRIDLGGWP
jgi:hypothetical protein